jgi:hypothetical protein
VDGFATLHETLQRLRVQLFNGECRTLQPNRPAQRGGTRVCQSAALPVGLHSVYRQLVAERDQPELRHAELADEWAL